MKSHLLVSPYFSLVSALSQLSPKSLFSKSFQLAVAKLTTSLSPKAKLRPRLLVTSERLIPSPVIQVSTVKDLLIVVAPSRLQLFLTQIVVAPSTQTALDATLTITLSQGFNSKSDWRHKLAINMSGTQMDPHDKMRARDVSKVARGEQAPRPAHEFGTVSPPPPPSSTNNNKKQAEQAETTENNVKSLPINYQTRHCYAEYVQYHRCIQQKGEKSSECEKIGRHFRSMCPSEWITEWDKERKEGRFPDEI